MLRIPIAKYSWRPCAVPKSLPGTGLEQATSVIFRNIPVDNLSYCPICICHPQVPLSPLMEA